MRTNSGLSVTSSISGSEATRQRRGDRLNPLIELAGRGCSCPQESLDEEVFEAVSVMYAQEALEQFLERSRARLSENGSGVVEVLSSWSRSQAGFREAWSPLPGVGLEAVRKRTSREVEHIAVSLLFHLHSQGIVGEWELATRSESSTRWRNNVLRPASRFNVQAEEEVATIKTSGSAGSDRYDLVWVDSAWSSTGASQLPTLRNTIVLLGRAALHSSEFASDSLRAAVLSEVSEADTANCRQGLDLIAEYGGQYLDWVLRVLREIALLAPRGSMVRSGGVGPHFGQIHMTSSPSRVLVAEMLVHEASHQYFELMRRLDPLEKSNADVEYYSPPVRRDRPLWALLKAYHAFANVELFYHALAAAGVPAAELGPVNRGQIHEDVAHLQRSLAEHARFTPLGQALFIPLRDRIDSL